MANAPLRNRLYDGNTFFRRVDSFTNPQMLRDGDISWGFNVTTAGLKVKTRPGMDPIFSVTCGKAQGLTLFTPTNSKPHLVAAISGRIWVSPYPFNTARMLNNITFDPTVDQVVFCETVQAKDLFSLVSPKAVLMMQDSRSPAAYWDGTIDEHVYPKLSGTIIGFQMEWVGNRLWVARDRQLFASDIYDPLHFTENQYLAQGGSFQAMDGNLITCLKRTADSQQLLVFTASNTTRINAGFTDRASWGSSENFITLAFPGVGCVGPKAAADVSGEMMWFSNEGVRRYNAVGASVFEAKNPISSHEMKQSFDRISDFKTRVCAFGFGSYAGFSVPAGSQWNRHTWVLDTSTTDTMEDQFPMAWQGVWTGTFPVEWTSGQVYDRKRCFHISQDLDGVRVWECFLDGNQDDGQEILCYFDSRAHDYQQRLAFKDFGYMEGHFSEALGVPPLEIFYKNNYGCWNKIADKKFCVTDCIQMSDSCIPSLAVDSQSRFLRTQEAIPDNCEDGSANQGGAPYMSFRGLSFKTRVKWTGRLALDRYKVTATEYQEISTGDCTNDPIEACVTLSCCDEEPDYLSHGGASPYYYGSGCGIVSF